MTIQTLISQMTPPLKPGDTVEYALSILMEFRVLHLPVVDSDGQLVGLISENQLLEAPGPDAPVASLLGPAPVSATPDSHVFDVTRLMVDHNLTALPVADDFLVYCGLVRRYDIFEQFARMLSTHEPGAILAIEASPNDYSVSQLAYLVEQNAARILSIASEDTEGMVRITLKLNVSDTSRVRAVLEHHGYRVVAAFSDEENDADLQLRAEEFMRYLEV